MKRCCEAEISDIAAKRKSNNSASKKRKCHDESTDEGAKCKSNDNALKKKKRQRQVSHDKEMSNAIERAIKEAKQILHRTHHPTNPHSHKAIVCIVCDQFIIGAEKIHTLTSY
jgi:hypothetical protein